MNVLPSLPAWANVLVFIGCAAGIWIAGTYLSNSTDVLSDRLHLGEALGGLILLAIATNLPELARPPRAASGCPVRYSARPCSPPPPAFPSCPTGLTSTRQGDYKLAFGDIFGGNTFLPVLFLLATLVSGKAILPHARPADLYLTGAGALLTLIYMAGLLFRPKKQHARMGIDSTAVLIVYLITVAGLVVLPS